MTRASTSDASVQQKRWRDRNKEQQNAYFLKLHHEGRTWAKRNPDKVKAKRRIRTLRQYGLTLAQWGSIFESQGRACAICRRADPVGPNWATDHCHDTGKVRGILCSRCNTGIGQMQDSPTTCRLAAEYLERHK